MRANIRWARVADGVELPYVEQGDASGLPLVCLHGYAESWRSFELVLALLPPEIRAFALSLRGHGGPRTFATDYSLEAIAADVAAFMDEVGIPAAVVAGSSSGGYVAQRLAVDRPECVTALVLIGAPRTLRGIAALDTFSRRLRELDDPVDPAFVREFIAGTLARTIPSGFLDVMIGEGVAVPARVWQATLAALAGAAPPTEVAAIAVPTLILWGERDGFVSRADADALRDSTPGSTLVTYEGTGHMPAWEEPARVARDVARFVRDLSPQPD